MVHSGHSSRFLCVSPCIFSLMVLGGITLVYCIRSFVFYLHDLFTPFTVEPHPLRLNHFKIAKVQVSLCFATMDSECMMCTKC
uniref:Uncharacterized protein n=1 Tax=Picea glauca TaxID=3330 RepID=A0A101M2S0_PICGL|nr:hypothetical protein ABT39_MTgene3227 [Picea glauca]QHR89275.1 hypothetical protein Q903MT_gene3296 [Picea sitchensis]